MSIGGEGRWWLKQFIPPSTQCLWGRGLGEPVSESVLFPLVPVAVMCVVTNLARQTSTSVSEDVEKRDPSGITAGNVNLCSRYGEQYGGSSKN